MGATRAACAGIAHSIMESGQKVETAEEKGIEFGVPAAAQTWTRLQANTDAPVTLSGPDLPAPGTVMSDGHYSELLKQIR